MKPVKDQEPPLSAPLVLLGAGFGGALYHRPLTIVRAETAPEAEEALKAIDAAVAAGRDVAGYLSYELGYLSEPRLRPLLPARRQVPLLLMGVFEAAEPPPPAPVGDSLHPPDLTPALGSQDYEAGVRRALQLIADGDIYQVNLTYALEGAAPDDLQALYAALLNSQPVPYSAIVDLGGPKIVSLSPELFFRIDSGRIIARPMKGTAKRARTLAEDEIAARDLFRDPKNRAENLMITDLLRNDLAKVAKPGSVRVPELFTVETYRTLHTLTSTVEADLRQDVQPSGIIRALFPCGSITGAPKIRAMEIIREIERAPRGVYCGAIGVFRGDGSACFNVAIRTLTVDQGKASLGVGGGIVADSDPEAEAAETQLKARFLTGLSPFAADQGPLGLIETLGWDGDYERFERHLARLSESAAYFRIPFDVDDALAELASHAQAFIEPMRVRLLLDAASDVHVTSAPLGPPAASWKCKFSTHRIDSSDPYRAHKTTRRGLYDEEHARAAKDGFDEVLFLNERGEIAEGSRTNVFLERGGMLLTPPISAGALPGVLRAELIEHGRAVEATLRADDLATGMLYAGNSLRGLIPLSLVL